MKQPYQRHKAAKEVYEFMRGLYNTLDRATRMDANGAKGIFIPRDVATPLVADTKAAADKLQSLLEHWSSADTGLTEAELEAKAASIMEAVSVSLEGGDMSRFSEDVQKQAAAVLDTTTKVLESHGDTDSGGRDTRSPKRPKS